MRSLLCLFTLFAIGECAKHNLSCYQCVRFTNQECAETDLVPCQPHYDRCVTHIEQNDRGYLIKRECGLGPCAFEDDMVNRGLGLDGCDRSKDDYFCVACCRTPGCNKNSGTHITFSATLVVFLCLIKLISLFS